MYYITTFGRLGGNTHNCNTGKILTLTKKQITNMFFLECACWWDITRNDCACCKKGVGAMQCGWTFRSSSPTISKIRFPQNSHFIELWRSLVKLSKSFPEKCKLENWLDDIVTHCRFPMHKFCYKKSDMGCPGVCNYKYTLSGKGYPCFSDHSK